MDDNEPDVVFAKLQPRLRRRIDRAFDSAIDSASVHHDISETPRKKRKLDSELSVGQSPYGGGGFLLQDAQPGGFIVEDQPGGFIPDEPPSGGFIREDQNDDGGSLTQRSRTHIPLSLIPSALQLLDLQPDDEDVLSVFRNAASGWGEDRRFPEKRADEDQVVSRKDWRAVCAALLDIREGAADEQPDKTEDAEMHEDEDESDSGEEYVEPESDQFQSSEGGNESDDEYQEDSAFVSPKGKAKVKRKAKGSQLSPARTSSRRGTRPSRLTESDEDNVALPKRLTPRQKQECRRTFGLFFSDVPDKMLDSQRIMIKDITRVAALLKEKITAEEIVEMLEVFSSSTDKSMSLGDFERMMIAAKLA